LDAGQIKSIKAKVSNLLKYAQSEEVQQILRSPGMVEQDFLLPLEGWLVQGRIDKWVMQEDGTIEIVDWKTDAGPADQSISKHQFQMQLYALAMENCGKLPKKQALIKVRLVLLDHEKIHDYEFSMDTLREFGAGLKAKLSEMKKLAGHPLNDEELAQLAV
jgi:RecB family exonuclease